MPVRSLAIAVLTAGLTLGAGCTGTSAQEWPMKQPLRLISPFPPGATPESVGRPVFDVVARAIGQTYVFENRTGAGGTIGMGTVARADPDGYTLLVNSAVHTITPITYPNTKYDTLKDLVPISPLAQFPNVLVVPASRYKTIQEMVAYARANPGKLTYASGGTGASTHLNAELLGISAGFKAVHVPFRGAPDALREVVGDRLDFYFSPLASALPVINAGDVRALAVSSLKRSAYLPDVPTTLEAGYPNSDYLFWLGVFAPRGTPQPIIDRLRVEIGKAMSDDNVKKVLANQGADPMPLDPKAFDEHLRKEVALNTKIVEAAGIKPSN
jgi:tripartite-type tricarboxylate transporter receptor subunit TctC